MGDVAAVEATAFLAGPNAARLTRSPPRRRCRHRDVLLAFTGRSTPKLIVDT
jgi:hypothetical protein